ncbi:MAG TPA: efflux RND transporter periplasmic adaptor subunit [Candidatus Cybelea sp.]|jgi:membrane fusion protein (multidrug efflux system)|nr:efflux RND transporter periplasmic adaptor subunit [Candidatus Cybelea sp.]
MKRRDGLGGLFGAALIFLAAAGCARHAPARAQTPVVQTSVVEFGTIQPARQLAGVVAPYQNVAIQSTLAEPADAVFVREGDAVRAGQVLATLNTADLQAQLQSDLATANSNHANTEHSVYQGSLSIAQGVDSLRTNEAAVRQAQQTLTNDNLNLSRDQKLLSQGYVSQQAVDAQQTLVRNDEQALNTANANLSSAQSNVQANGSLSGNGIQAAAVKQSQAQEDVALAQAQQVRVQIGKASIVSPIDGVVVNRNINPGEYPGNRQIFTLQQVNPIYAVLHASSQQVSSISNGSPASVVAEDLNGSAHFLGHVVGVLNEINPGSTDFQIKVLLSNPGQRLRPGMVVQGNVDAAQVRGVRVPVTAFTDDNHDAVMTVQSGDSVKTMKVAELGSDGTTSVVSGLIPGTRVVNDGQASLGDGEKVSFQQ